MKFLAEINIMPRQELLDPQGKVVTNSLKNLNIEGIEHVRVGKCVTMYVHAANEKEAEEKIKSSCEKLLVNPIMEHYHYSFQVVG